MSLTISIQGLPGYGDEQGEADSAAGMDLVDAAQMTAQHFPGGVPALAKAMGVSPNTLQHKLNTNNDRYILGLKESLLIQQVTGNNAVLHAMAAALGFTCTRAVADQSGGDPMEAFWRFQQEMVDFTQAATNCFKPGATPSRNAHRRLEYHANELAAALNHLVAASAVLLPKDRDAV